MTDVAALQLVDDVGNIHEQQTGITSYMKSMIQTPPPTEIFENDGSYSKYMIPAMVKSDHTALSASTPCPFDTAHWYERVSFHWSYSLLKYGFRNHLQLDDLWDVSIDDESRGLLHRLESAYVDIKSKSSSSPGSLFSDRMLLRAIVRGLFRDYWFVGIWAGFVTVGRMSGPIFIKMLLEYMQDPLQTDMSGLLWAFLLCCSSLLCLMCHHQEFWISMRCGYQFRAACVCLIAKKTLKLPMGGNPQLMTLVTADVSRFDDALPFLWFLVWAPVEFITSFFILKSWIGLMPTIAGLSIFVFYLPFQIYISYRFKNQRYVTAGLTDKRVTLITEILRSIEVVKMYCWTDALLKRIFHERENEIKSVRSKTTLLAVNVAFFFAVPCILSFACFSAYWASGAVFVPSTIYSALGILILLRMTCVMFINRALETGGELIVSLSRIQNLLNETEMDECNQFIVPTSTPSPVSSSSAVPSLVVSTQKQKEQRSSLLCTEMILSSDSPEVALSKQLSTGVNTRSSPIDFISYRTSSGSDSSPLPLHKDQHPISQPSLTSVPSIHNQADTAVISLYNASFRWNSETRCSLHNISLHIPRGALVFVIGSVASGKSSLLNALLGEMRLEEGEVTIKNESNPIAYAAQTPFILPGTIRDNITFGEVYDKRHMDDVLHACALSRDLELFGSTGDLTEIGERGVNLSGGQRSRVSLARCCYNAHADIVLLDDPLSAVDPYVGKHLVDHCFDSENMLARKTRVIVTHNIDVLYKADLVIVMENGRVRAQGQWKDTEFRDIVKEVVLMRSVSSGVEMKTDSESVPKTAIASTDAESDSEKSEAGNEYIEKEHRQYGTIGLSVFLSHARSCGGLNLALMVGILMIIGQVLAILCDWWLAYWSSQSSAGQDNTNNNFYIFLALCVLTVLFSNARAIAFFRVAVNASLKLHNRALVAVLASPIRFFHANPIGRIINRFAKDVSIADELLPYVYYDVITLGLMALGSLCVIGLGFPIILIICPPIIFILYRLRRFYVASSREIKRLDGISRSPILSHFNSMVHGISTIRAFKKQSFYFSLFHDMVDVNQRCQTAHLGTTRWLGFWLDIVVFCLLVILSFGAVLSKSFFDQPALLGMSLLYALQLTGLFQWATRQSVELENHMTSIERINEFVELPSEADLNFEMTGVRPVPAPLNWPSYSSSVEFLNVEMRYRDGFPLVLRGLSFRISGGDRVGIVGRTGAGKSSLGVALFRLTNITSGNIFVDSVDISTIPLSQARDSIAIIPQQPVLFAGSWRSALDPLEMYTDEQILSAIETCQLRPILDREPDGLLSMISDGGSNLSVGTRQLICLARALLKNCRLMFVDEATANVDHATDKAITSILYNHPHFSGVTMLIIAHRIRTIMDCTKVVVIDHGTCAEIGKPSDLLLDSSSLFSKIVEESKQKK